MINFNERKFDSTICFMFFADWLEVMERTETEADRESKSYMFFKAIANYSLYGEIPDFDANDASKSFEQFWPMLENQIDSSIKNRKRQFNGGSGPTENAKKVIEAYRKNPGMSVRDVERETGVSKSEVSRIKRKYIHAEDVPGSFPGSSPDSNNCPDTNTNMGHRTGRDTGQLSVWKRDDGETDTECPNSIWDTGAYEDDGDLPF